MNRVREFRARQWWVVLLAAGWVVSLGGCSFHASASTKTGADARSSQRERTAASGGSRTEAKARGKAKGRTESSGGTKSSSGGNISVSGSSKVSAKAKGEVKAIFATKPRSKKITKSRKDDDFCATDLVRGGGSGSENASGSPDKDLADKDKPDQKKKKTPTGSAQVENTEREKEKSGSAQAENKKRRRSSGQGDGESASKTSDKGTSKGDERTASKDEGDKPKATKDGDRVAEKKGKRDKGKKDDEVVAIEPPEEPPENVFGYEEPVRGCFEGVVYPLAANTNRLPVDFGNLEGISVVYACEWDIPTRDWSQGFPGIEDRFEWFAIQYRGSFAVQEAGTWTFRISSDDGAKLYIDGKVVIDNDGAHPPRQKSGRVRLEKGDHDMVLEYFQGPRYHINLQLFATPPRGEEGVFSVR